MRKRSVLILLILVQGFSGLLFGQEKYNLEIGPYAGVGVWQDRSFQLGPPQASPAVKFGFHLAEKPVYGVRFNLLSRGHWGGEVAYAYQNNTVTLSLPPSLSRPSIRPVPLEGAVHHFFYNEVFYPVRYGHSVLIPFLTAGIGVAGYHLDDEAQAQDLRAFGFGSGRVVSMDSRFAFNYGGGVKTNLTPSFGIRADFRHTFSDVPTFGFPKQSSNPAQTVLPVGGKLQMYEASAGIYFHIAK